MEPSVPGHHLFIDDRNNALFGILTIVDASTSFRAFFLRWPELILCE
jgi:hypothetical protein